MTDAEYSQHLFEFGIQTAEFQVGEQMARYRVQTTSFWRWFENQFAITDQLFLSHFDRASGDLQTLTRVWRHYHSPERLVAFPSNEVYKEELALSYQLKSKYNEG